MIKIGLFICALIIFTGCMSEKERMIKEGYPQNYAQGYEDGCSTGNSEAGMWTSFKKNVRLYDTNRDYHRGWNEGKDHCYKKQKSYQDVQMQQAIQNKLYEKKKK